MDLYTVAVVVLVAIIAYLIFRLLKQKVPARKKSVVTASDKKEMSPTKNIVVALFFLGSFGAFVGASAASMMVSVATGYGFILFLLSFILFIIGLVLVIKK